jgi:hypothetical protein
MMSLHLLVFSKKVFQSLEEDLTFSHARKVFRSLEWDHLHSPIGKKPGPLGEPLPRYRAKLFQHGGK